jgi:hypothetical protein
MTINWNNANHIRSNLKDFVGSLIQPWWKKLTSFQQLKIQITKFHFNYLRKDINSKLSSGSSIPDKSHTVYCEDLAAGSAYSYFFHSYYLLPPGHRQISAGIYTNIARFSRQPCSHTVAGMYQGVRHRRCCHMREFFFKVHEWWKNSI